MTGANALYHAVLTLSYDLPSGTSQGTYQERVLVHDGATETAVLSEVVRAANKFFGVDPSAHTSILYYRLTPDTIRVPERRTGVEPGEPT